MFERNGGECARKPHVTVDKFVDANASPFNTHQFVSTSEMKDGECGLLSVS
jgi:hypothetical protein